MSWLTLCKIARTLGVFWFCIWTVFHPTILVTRIDVLVVIVLGLLSEEIGREEHKLEKRRSIYFR